MGNTQTKTRPAVLVGALSILLFFYGFYLGGVQLVVADISASFGMALTGVGILAAAEHVAAVLLPVIFGRLADKFRKKTILLIFAVIFGTGCLLTALVPQLYGYLLGALLIGAGYSVCESVASAVLLDLDAEKGAQYVNLSQGILTAGAVVGPLLLQGLMKATGLDWRLLFAICAAAYYVMVLAVSRLAFPVPAVVQTQQTESKPRYLASPLFLCMFVSLFLYCGMENGISYFADSLFDRELGRGNLGSVAISAYWAGMTISRLIFSMTLKKPLRVLTLCFAASSLVLACVGLSHSAGLTLALCALTGFAYGPIWSTLVATAAGAFPNASAGATGLMSAAGAVGGFSFPVVIGAVGDASGIPVAFFFLGAAGLLGAVLCAAAGKRE